MAERYQKYSVEQVIEAIRETKGMIVTAARNIGCSPVTLYKYAERHPTIAQAIKDEREHVTDRAELSLYKKIEEGEAWAVCFYLKTQGRNRGYIERKEVTGGDGGAVTLRIVYGDDSDVS